MDDRDFALEYLLSLEQVQVILYVILYIQINDLVFIVNNYLYINIHSGIDV